MRSLGQCQFLSSLPHFHSHIYAVLAHHGSDLYSYIVVVIVTHLRILANYK